MSSSCVLIRRGILAMLAAFLLVAGANAQQDARNSTLMQAIFGDSHDPDHGRTLAMVRGEAGKNTYRLMTLAATTGLPDGRSIVIVKGVPSNQDGTDESSHLTPGELYVYTMRHTAGGWAILERHEKVAPIGAVQWMDLGRGKPGFIVHVADDYHGYGNSIAYLFALDQHLRPLGRLQEASDNNGACMPESAKCWDIGSGIRIDAATPTGTYPDLLVDFTGKYYRMTYGKDHDLAEHPVREIRQSARYRFDGKVYVLTAGANPAEDL